MRNVTPRLFDNYSYYNLRRSAFNRRRGSMARLHFRRSRDASGKRPRHGARSSSRITGTRARKLAQGTTHPERTAHSRCTSPPFNCPITAIIALSFRRQPLDFNRTMDSIAGNRRNETVALMGSRSPRGRRGRTEGRLALAMFGALSCAQCCVWNTWGPIAASTLRAFPSWNESLVALLFDWGCVSYLTCCVPCCWLLYRKGDSPPPV